MSRVPTDVRNLTGELAVESVVSVDEQSHHFLPVPVASLESDGVYIGWRQLRRNIQILWSPDVQTFQSKQVLPYASTIAGAELFGTRPAGPSLTSFEGSLLVAWPYEVKGWRGELGDRKPAVMWGSAHDVVIAGESKDHRVHKGLSISALRDGVGLVWTGKGRVMVARSQGRVFGEPMQLGKSWAPPYVCTLNDELVVLWREGSPFGKNPLRMATTQGGVFQPPVDFPKDLPDLRMCDLDGELAVAWAQSGAIGVGFLRSDGVVPALMLDLPWRSSSTPCICAHQGGLVVTWTPGRDPIYVAHIRRT